MKKWQKRGIVGVFILVSIVGVKAFWTKSIKAETVPVKRAIVSETVVEKGTIVSDKASDIYSEVQGKVKAVYVDEGDSVHKGQLLAEIDTSDVESQISQLQGEMKVVEGSGEASQSVSGTDYVKQLEIKRDQAQLEYNQANSDYQRILSLYKSEGVSQATLEQTKTQMEISQKALNLAISALSSAQKNSSGTGLQTTGQRESIQAQLKYLREHKVKARINADCDGVIFEKLVKEGNYISQGTKLFKIGNLQRFRIETYLGSKDRAYLRTGDTVSIVVKLPGRDIELPGAISRIAPSAQQIQSTLGVMEDKVKITLDLKEFPAGLPITPGTSVDVRFVTQQSKDVLAVPKETIFSDQGKDYVWAVRQGTITLVSIVKGIEGDDLDEVKRGLIEGETIIVNPHEEQIKPGLKVK